jgi:hypothetical protein
MLLPVGYDFVGHFSRRLASFCSEHRCSLIDTACAAVY